MFKSPYPWIFFLSLSLLHICSEARVLRYKMYRNPPKQKILLLPLESSHLPLPAKKMVQDALFGDANLLKQYKLILPRTPHDSLPKSPEGIRLLPAREGADYVMRTRLEFQDNRYLFFSEIFEPKSERRLAAYFQDCNCPIGEVIYWILPDALNQLDKRLSRQPDACPKGMVAIPGGSFLPMESDSSQGEPVELSPYCMDRFEYPNRAKDFPYVNKSWEEAADICSRQGKRLCSENEWERACRGNGAPRYPYGDDYTSGNCNTEGQSFRSLGEQERCRSTLGIHDLSGNVSEWTASPWSADSFGEISVRGGYWDSREEATCAVRHSQPAGSPSKAIGFRCCADLPEPP